MRALLDRTSRGSVIDRSADYPRSDEGVVLDRSYRPIEGQPPRGVGGGTARAPAPPPPPHAAIGDGRTVALVATDGTIDWLPFPDIDSGSLFGSILDHRLGGRFVVTPGTGYETRRRYLPDTNVLETTFITPVGSARITDAMTIPSGGLTPFRELVRKIDGISGTVPFTYEIEPRFGFGETPTTLEMHSGIPVASDGRDAVAFCSWDGGSPAVDGRSILGTFSTSPGSAATLVLAGAHGEPVVLPAREDVEKRLRSTEETWRRWSSGAAYNGPWRDEVLRSALLLQLLVMAPYGSVAAAPTTSLPEEFGGSRNWDYRFCWIRDSAFTMDAFLQLGSHDQAHAFFWWLMHASQLTHPRLNVLYRMDGGTHAPERTIPFEGYRGSAPVRIGNGALDQFQLDIYGDLFLTAFLYASSGLRIDREIGRRLAEIADYICTIWDRPDSGMWEVRSDREQFTQSKMMCALALERAGELADRGQLPRGKADWAGTARAVRRFVEDRCFSQVRSSYVRSAGSDDLDASVLLGAVFGYADPAGDRFASTIRAIRSELAQGPLVRRYLGEDGLPGDEGAFLACSFWLVEALSRSGRKDEAAELMNELLGFANDVGLFPEEIDPATGAFLGNFPQGLTHLALISAATSFREDGS
jgi:GH15 family glucan-1,4-alpha-glucosidase